MSEQHPAASAGDTHIVTLEPTTVAVRRETVEMAKIRDYFDGVYGAVAGVVAEQGASIIGPAVAVYRGMSDVSADVAAGFPTDRPIEGTGGIAADTLPGGIAARHVHRGSYDGLAGAYETLLAWMGEHGHTPGEQWWEIYVTEPTPDADPQSMVTEIIWPLSTHAG